MVKSARILSKGVALALALALLTAAPALAQTKTLYWERFDVDITVLANGDLSVVETQVITFTSGTFREGFAELDTTNSDGITDVRVSEDGVAYALQPAVSEGDRGVYAVNRLEGGNLEVVWAMGATRDTTRTFELSYVVTGAIRRYAEGNEFQWNAISPGLHAFEIRSATVTLHMPENAPVTYADYLVRPAFAGVPMTVTESPDRRTVTWVADEMLGPSDGIQIVVQFPPDTVGGGKPSWQAAYDLRANWEDTAKPLVDLGLAVLGLLLLVGGPVGLYLLWYLRGRDPRPGAVPEHLLAPPADIPPGIAGTLVDEDADTADIIATLVDLARRGYLEIQETEMPSAVGLGRDFRLSKTERATALDELHEHERALYTAVFGQKSKVRMRELNQKFYVHLPNLRTKLYEAAVRLGYFGSRPDAVRTRYRIVGGSLLALALIGACPLTAAFSEWTSTLGCPFMALALVGLGMIWLGQHMPVKSRKGAEAAALCLAFKNYLTNLERYSAPASVAEQFDRYLPYAIAFGLERSWINRFRNVPAMPPPIWYRPYVRAPAGAGGKSAAPATSEGGAPSLQTLSNGMSSSLQSMSDGLNTMLNSAARTLTSTPPASSSGTSSGGRSFSGGGGFRSSGGSGGGGRGFR